MPILCDVNFLIALNYRDHAQHESALQWLSEHHSAGELALCRVVQLGMFRLVTHPVVLKADVLSNTEAWSFFDALMRDVRFRFVEEPAGLDRVLRRLANSAQSTPKLWTDAYLAAFAIAAQYQLVTYDRAFAQFDGLDALILT